jgi:hypothetical protein
LLEKGYIISLFYPPAIPKPISIIMAEQGSAKTTEDEFKKKLVDPSSVETLTFPRDINELVQKLSHNYVAYFDNVSKIQYWLSDQLCRASTGSGFSKRELYTDDEDIIYNFILCTGINGINIIGLRPDLLDRSILRKRQPILKHKRRKKEDIQAEFEQMRPQLLGYIFDVLAKVLQVKASGGIKLDYLPRMADFAEIGEIACRCMGYEDNEFLKAYDKNIETQVEEAIAANLVSSAIIKLMEDRTEWTGTATQLLAVLEDIAITHLKVNTNTKQWPKAANVLSGRLEEVKTNLREIGILIDKEAAKDPNTRTRTIYICKTSLGSLESFASLQENSTEYSHNTIDKNLTNSLNDANDTLHISQSQSQTPDAISADVEEGYYRCYYCDEYKSNDEREYTIHVINVHGKRAFPDKAEIEKEGLTPQGKPWES